jgi:hypothetical protein
VSFFIFTDISLEIKKNSLTHLNLYTEMGKI